MIGKLVQVDENVALLERDGICYELFLPAYAAEALANTVGLETTFYTIEYYEGTAVGANLFPRLVGFHELADRAFFLEFIKVKGMGIKKALRAFARPASWIASAIEQGDAGRLATLPELGKRTSEQLIATLKGKLEKFADLEPISPTEVLTQAQREALEILLQLGERRSEAATHIQQAVRQDKHLTDPARIVEAVYKLKSGLI